MDGVVHFQIPAKNVGRARKFYAKAFGWGTVEPPGMGGYVLLQTAKTDRKGMLKEKGKINGGLMKKMGKNDKLEIVIAVKNIDATIRKAKAMGAKLISPKGEIQGVGTYARIADTEGNSIGILQPVKM
ncbi:MAG: VOC family protein [Candidatus Micrarchaeota archaeon]|nr:VOC family protein [Candidatus Micrarchaeota archaeon]MDE1847118.1 VOC family protein [Candidatus Micrarchaeota archaeon]